MKIHQIIKIEKNKAYQDEEAKAKYIACGKIVEGLINYLKTGNINNLSGIKKQKENLVNIVTSCIESSAELKSKYGNNAQNFTKEVKKINNVTELVNMLMTVFNDIANNSQASSPNNELAKKLEETLRKNRINSNMDANEDESEDESEDGNPYDNETYAILKNLNLSVEDAERNSKALNYLLESYVYTLESYVYTLYKIKLLSEPNTTDNKVNRVRQAAEYGFIGYLNVQLFLGLLKNHKKYGFNSEKEILNECSKFKNNYCPENRIAYTPEKLLDFFDSKTKKVEFRNDESLEKKLSEAAKKLKLRRAESKNESGEPKKKENEDEIENKNKNETEGFIEALADIVRKREAEEDSDDEPEEDEGDWGE